MRAIVRVCASRELKTTGVQPRRGFSLIDVLVSLSVITVLVGLMLPALSGIRETGRQVVCSSNIRQIGIGVVMYADDFKRNLPHSRYYAKSINSDSDFVPQSLMLAKVPPPGAVPPINYNPWDGVGMLFTRGYCAAAPVFYCPSHRSSHRYETYADGWGSQMSLVYTNFQYRGGSDNGKTNLDVIGDRISMLADGMASGFDFNHAVGGNIVATDLSVAWFDDPARRLDLPSGYTDPDAKNKLRDAWATIDQQLYK